MVIINKIVDWPKQVAFGYNCPGNEDQFVNTSMFDVKIRGRDQGCRIKELS